MSQEKKTTKKYKGSSRVSNNAIANDFCNSAQFKENLVYFLSYDSFFVYTDNKYFRKLTERDLQKLVLRFCEVIFPGQGFTNSQVKDIIDLIRLKVIREEDKEETQYIAFNDCLYNTRTHTTEEFSPQRLVTWYMPYNLSQLNDPTPVFQKFLETSLVEEKSHTTPDYELINFVQEMFGFFMLDTFYATGAFFMYGMGSNGKSVMMDLLDNIFGDDYVSALSLANFNDKFAVKDIINKRLNISREEDEKFVSAKMFKTLVTGEPVRGEHKFGNGFKMKPTCKFLFGTNKLPTFDGFDYGLKRRLFLIPFHRQFLPHEQDKHLVEKLVKEIPGIIGWALEGAKRLEKNNFIFSDSRAVADLFAEFEEEMSAAIMFFNENYIVDDEFKTSKQELYDHYLVWAKDNGKKGSYSKRRFNKELVDNIKGLNGELFGINSEGSFRAYNCRRSDRDVREATIASNKEKGYLEGEEAKTAHPDLATLL